MRASTLTILLAAYAVVFLESWTTFFRYWVGAQPELLPSLMVYAALRLSLPAVALTALFGGLGLDSLSANPFGVSVLPLGALGLALHALRGMIVQEDRSVQFALGAGASGLVPLAQLTLIVAVGGEPLWGAWSLWRWFVMAILGGLCTPLWFRLFARLDQALNYQPEASVAFRADREIDRGQDPHADS
jgi:rod shape-determining protein MreD